MPQVFTKGKYIGGADIIKNMFEVGKFFKILDGFSRRQLGFVCESFGDVRFVPCGNWLRFLMGFQEHFQFFIN